MKLHTRAPLLAGPQHKSLAVAKMAWPDSIQPGIGGFRDLTTGRWYPYMRGGDGGYSDTRDLLVNLSNVPFTVLWDDLQFILAQYNQIVDDVTSSILIRTQEIGVREQVPGSMRFEKGTEYGRPDRQRQGAFKTRGLPLWKYQLGIGFTRDFLLNATTQEIDSQHNAALVADRELMLNEILTTLYNNANYTFEDPRGGEVTVRAFYNGDGEVPPMFQGVVFAGSHTHYLRSAGATFADVDIDTIRTRLLEHGHDGNRVIWASQNLEASFRALDGWADNWNFYNPNVAPGPGSQINVAVVEAPYAGVVKGFRVRFFQGWLPNNYVFAWNDYGPGTRYSPLAMREPMNDLQVGLQLINPDGNDTYPIIDSFYERWMGFAVNSRSNGVAMLVAGSGSYVAPTFTGAL